MAVACPANGELGNSTALDAMLAARASSQRELVILVLGWTNGGAQITMREGVLPSLIDKAAVHVEKSIEAYMAQA